MAECVFCGRSNKDTRILFNGQNPNKQHNYGICEQCCRNAYKFLDIQQDKISTEKRNGAWSRFKPSAIKSKLDQYIIGQDEAKMTLAVAVYNHYKRICSKEEGRDTPIQKSNVMIMGPTGSGKTYLIQTLAKILDVPMAIADATAMTESGYVGDDVETCLQRLLVSARGSIEAAQHGIIYIDEIDKLARMGENRSITRDVSGEGVQQALLKIVEGTQALVPTSGTRKAPNGDNVMIDTSNILFICGGAFEGISQLLESKESRRIGFGAEKDEEQANIQAITDAKLIVKYGMLPELVGRFPVITATTALDAEALKRIITEPKNAIIKQYKRLLGMDGVNLEFTDDAILAIANRAIKSNTGARGLRSSIEKIMNRLMFEAPDMDVDKIIVDKDTVENGAEPKYLKNGVA